VDASRATNRSRRGASWRLLLTWLCLNRRRAAPSSTAPRPLRHRCRAARVADPSTVRRPSSRLADPCRLLGGPPARVRAARACSFADGQRLAPPSVDLHAELGLDSLCRLASPVLLSLSVCRAARSLGRDRAPSLASARLLLASLLIAVQRPRSRCSLQGRATARRRGHGELRLSHFLSATSSPSPGTLCVFDTGCCALAAYASLIATRLASFGSNAPPIHPKPPNERMHRLPGSVG